MPKETAIITGASSGIGKIYAERLASRGYDVLLVSRRQDRLLQIAAELEARFSVRAEVLVADLSKAEGVTAVVHRISTDESVTFLVNNAGFSALKPLTEMPFHLIESMVALNITALTALSQEALRRFGGRRNGTIVNIGSGVGFAPMSMVPVYGPTKAYVLQFTQILQQQAADSGVRVQLVVPGAVVSEGWDVAGGADLDPLPASLVMTTENCVDAALSGLDRGEQITAPSLHDETLLKNYEAASKSLLQGMFCGQPASRYGLAV